MSGRVKVSPPLHKEAREFYLLRAFSAVPQAVVHKAAKEKPKFPGGQSFTFHHSSSLFFSLHERKSVGFPSFFSFFWPLISVKKKTEGEGGGESKKKNTPCFSPAKETGKNAFLFFPICVAQSRREEEEEWWLIVFCPRAPLFLSVWNVFFFRPLLRYDFSFPSQKELPWNIHLLAATYVVSKIFLNREACWFNSIAVQREIKSKKIKLFFRPVQISACFSEKSASTASWSRPLIFFFGLPQVWSTVFRFRPLSFLGPTKIFHPSHTWLWFCRAPQETCCPSKPLSSHLCVACWLANSTGGSWRGEGRMLCSLGWRKGDGGAFPRHKWGREKQEHTAGFSYNRPLFFTLNLNQESPWKLVYYRDE